MPKLIIDDRDIDVPAGTKVIEAAEQLGIMIPRFCYHPALGSVGACRVCAVKFLQGPFKGVQMSCMIDAQDGMVVSTTDGEAVEFRRYVIEWLMLHHPHDCPVCDEGGHCLLQDMTISGGHGIRRYLGHKRTYPDQYLGPLVQHEMNRCIHCYRCARYYQEFSGYRDLGTLQIANRTYFGRFAPGVLESPFAGNLSDLCPTGVYTDRPSRYKGRRWDYQRSPAVCINCSLGCHTTVSARYREIVRQEARYSPRVNGHFICDRGRFGFYYNEDARRPRRARLGDRWVSPSEGLKAAKAKLDDAAARRGPAAIAGIAGLRCSLETQIALHRLCRNKDWSGPSFFPDSGARRRVAAAAGRLSADLAVSLREIEQADVVVVVGADPINEAPMLALALRQAWRTEAAVAVIDPRPVALPLTFTRMAVPPDGLDRVLAGLCRDSVDKAAAESLGPAATGFYRALEETAPAGKDLDEKLTSVAELLRNSRKPVIVCGTDLVCNGLPDRAADAALLLRAAGKTAGLFYTMPGAGAFSAALLSERALEEVLVAIESGDIRALLVTETDPFRRFPDRRRLEKALDRLELLVVIDYLDSDISAKADILLPAATLHESGGLYINQEGRAQRSPVVYRGGESVLATGRRDHPPRVYSADIPGAGPAPPRRILAALNEDKDPVDTAAALQFLAETVPDLENVPAGDDIPEEGLRLCFASQPDRHFHPKPLSAGGRPQSGLQLVLTERTFGTETLSIRSACLEKVTDVPCAFVHPDDADSLGLSDGAGVTVETDRGRLTLPVRVSATMAEGVFVLPRQAGVNWQIFESGSAVIPRERITPANNAHSDQKG